ncbi:GFA family protein [Shewanella sp. 202IG2-18]|uniref:GFA family protein n=1 Tax=Parashewanella hymeniacidonis TaxID=2807618 RepID=UPI001960CA39|nr:GFA family protein [Parashewanella hymeniacidonis]MBM7073679.1 GFA family protein [Parashewanella hymeniacidonis]
MDINQIYKSTCHCGAIELSLFLPKGLENLRRCNCSMCSRRGAIVASVPLANLKLVKGIESLSLYQFNTHTAKHYFCSQCGIYTHHQRRSYPEFYGVNVACIEGIKPYELGEIQVVDGINHPRDNDS